MSFNKKFFTTGGIVASTPSAPAGLDPLQNFETVTYTGNGGTQKITGYIRKGAAFNGTTSQITTVGNPIPSTSSLFSISFWFQLDTTSTNNHIFSIFDNVTNKLLIRSLTGGDFQIGVYGTSGSNFISTNSSTFPYTTGVWYHLVYISRSNGNNEFWIDGTQIATSSGVAANTTSSSVPITMGGREDFGASTTERFGGKLDQVRIFNTALNSTQVGQLALETYADPKKSTTDYFGDGSGVALYELDEDANDTGTTPYGTGAIDSGQSAVFNGTNSALSANRMFSTASSYSISFWAKMAAGTTTENCYFWQISGVTQRALMVNYSGSGTNYTFTFNHKGATNNGQASAVTFVPDGNWHHFTGTFNSSTSTGSLYIDGVEKNTFTLDPVLDTGSTLYMGGNYVYNNVQYYVPLSGLDQIRIYDTALSASDVEALVSETNVPTANLVAHYKLDGNANDETTNYDGTWSGTEAYSDPAEFPFIAYNGTPTNVNFLGMAFQPDFVWIKNRSTVSNHILQNTVAGINTPQYSDETYLGTANSPFGHVDSVESNGFTVDDGGSTEVNANSLNHNFVAWCWKAGGSVTPNNNTNGTIPSTVSANQDAGFSISKFTIPSSGSYVTVGHGLSSPPQLMIVKTLDKTGSWFVYTETTGADKEAYLELSNTWGTDLNRWANTAPTSSVFTLGSSWLNSTYSGEAIAYCFHSVDGYQKVGSYDGGTITSSNIVNLGFRPRFVLLKTTQTTNDWLIYDTVRDTTNPYQNILYPATSGVEQVATNDDYNLYLTDDGFYFNNTNGFINSSASDVIYLAIA